MKNAWLRAADLKPDEFLDLVGKLGPRNALPARRIWLEAADGWAFDWWFDFDRDLNWCGSAREPYAESTRSCLSRSNAGRIFAPDGELRWRVIPALGDACWRTIFLGDGDWPIATLVDYSEHLRELVPKQERYFLWGQQTKITRGEWVELRIPHRFRYPVDGNPRHVLALAEQWYDDVGEPHFLRLSDLEPAPEFTDA